MQWLQEGDHNTKFFHAATVQRRHINRIEKLEGQNGEVCGWEGEITSEICEYYENIFTTSDPTVGHDVLDGIQRKITDSMNVLLTRPIEDQEIKKLYSQ